MIDELNSQIGVRVHVRRRQIGLTQKQVAQAAGITTQQIQKYEDGLARISAARLWQFSRILCVEPIFFYEELDASGAA